MCKVWRQVSIIVVVALIAAWYGGPPAVSAQQGGKVVFLGVGGPYQEGMRKAFFQPFERKTGIQVIEDTGLSQERIQAEVQSGRPSFDFLTTSTNTYRTFLDKNYLAPLDYKDFDPADLKAMPESAREKFGVNSVNLALLAGFSTSAFSDGKPQPQSWADFWDVKKFPGKRALPYCDTLEGAWPIGEAALLADGVPKDKLYPLDIPRAVNKLKELAPNVIWFRNTSQPGQLLTTQEAVMALDSSGRLNALIDKGAPLKLVWSTARHEGDKWLVVRGAPNLDNAMRYLAFAVGAQPQAELARVIGYAPGNPRAYEFIDKSVGSRLPTFPENMKQGFVKDTDWWLANRNKWVEACMNGIVR